MKRAVLLLASSLIACTASAQTKDVVVVGGALAEIVYALGAENRIAATDTTALYPPAARDTPKVGYQRSLSAEGVLSLKPKLVLAASEAGPPAAIAQIRNAGVRVESFNAEHSAAQVLAYIERIATLLDVPKDGQKLVARMRAELDQMRDQVAAYGAKKPRVLFLLAHGGSPQVTGEGTAAHAMIELAGGENVMKGFSGYRPLTAEAATAAAPDVILITDQGLDAQGGIAGLLTKPGLALTPAGQNKRVVKMDALQLLGFGPRLPATVSSLARLLRENK